MLFDRLTLFRWLVLLMCVCATCRCDESARRLAVVGNRYKKAGFKPAFFDWIQSLL